MDLMGCKVSSGLFLTPLADDGGPAFCLWSWCCHPVALATTVLMPCRLLIYRVDILAASSRAGLWPVQNCVPLILLFHLPTLLTFTGGVAELDFLFAGQIYFYITLGCWTITCNNDSIYRDDTSSCSYFRMVLFVLHSKEPCWHL